MKRLNKRGQVTLFISFFILAIIIVVIGAVFAPMGVLFNVKMFEAGEDIMIDANSSIQNIKDTQVRSSIQSVLNAGIKETQNNIEVNTNIFQYSWVILLVLSALVVFIQTRRLVEFGGGGFI